MDLRVSILTVICLLPIAGNANQSGTQRMITSLKTSLESFRSATLDRLTEIEEAQDAQEACGLIGSVYSPGHQESNEQGCVAVSQGGNAIDWRKELVSEVNGRKKQTLDITFEPGETLEIVHTLTGRMDRDAHCEIEVDGTVQKILVIEEYQPDRSAELALLKDRTGAIFSGSHGLRKEFPYHSLGSNLICKGSSGVRVNVKRYRYVPIEL